MIDLAAISAPFPADRISWRVGSTTQDKKKGMALAYIDARDVYERLDAVCGPAGWQCRYPHADKKTVCEIGIKVGDEWIWKANGAGDSDVEAEKGALSDAVKRAAVVWGIGRYLYDVASPWVPIEPAGKSFKITEEGLNQLRRSLGRSAPAATPSIARREEKATEDVGEHAEYLGDLVRRCGSIDALEVLRTDPSFKADFKALPLALQATVGAVIKTKREQLQEAA